MAFLEHFWRRRQHLSMKQPRNFSHSVSLSFTVVICPYVPDSALPFPSCFIGLGTVSLGRIRRAVHVVGTHKSENRAETQGVAGLSLPMKKDKHRASLYSQRVQQAKY